MRPLNRRSARYTNRSLGWVVQLPLVPEHFSGEQPDCAAPLGGAAFSPAAGRLHETAFRLLSMVSEKRYFRRRESTGMAVL